jgi:hypothetical protein
MHEEKEKEKKRSAADASANADEEREQRKKLSLAEEKLSQMKMERDDWLSQLRTTQIELGEANELCR